MQNQRPDSPGPSCVSMMSDGCKALCKDEHSSDGRIQMQRPDSPGPSCVSLKSDASKDAFLTLKIKDSPGPSCVSLKSDASKDAFVNFKDKGIQMQRPDSPGPSCVSLKSDASKDAFVNFKDKGIQMQRPDSPGPSCVSLKSDASKDAFFNFKDKGVQQEHTEAQQTAQWPQTYLDSTFVLLKKNFHSFVENELQRVQMFFSPDDQTGLESQSEDEEQMNIREAFLKITLHLLRRAELGEMADYLRNKSVPAVCQQKVKHSLKKKFCCMCKGIARAGIHTHLNEIYTDIYITEGGTGEVNDEHEVRQIERAYRKPHRPETTIKQEDFFKPSPERQEPIRTVMTKGVAGIGKTVLTQKFTLDWAEDKAHQDIQFTFPFTFKELNVLQEEKLTLVDLVHLFFPETKEAGICRFEEFKVVFIFDGLDECRLPLDFKNNVILTDVTESASVDVLLTNLISGKLLPSVYVWVTTRPAAADQIPPDCVDMVTDVRGFTDPQKEDYFRKRFRDEEQSNAVISHIKTSQSLNIMCHIPVFCWIIASVLEDVLTIKRGEMPKTLTEMYIHFLVVQFKLKNVKYDGGTETDSHWNSKNRKMIESLGKLAFEQLQKDNLIFYESDLIECGIDIGAASRYSGVFTQIFKQERGLYRDKVFCFVHLSIQEFLAALHVHLTFTSSGVNLLSREQKTSQISCFFKGKKSPKHFYQSAIDLSLQNSNGHWDLFLRFLLGLSLKTNQNYMQGHPTPIGENSKTKKKTVQYIKTKIRANLSAEESINLFHCLNELQDSSLVEQIQQSLRSGNLSADDLSHAQWSALVFILLSSGKDLDVFDLKKYCDSEMALLRLLPVIKASNRALLSSCKLSERSCEALSSVLSSESSRLRELDLSNNNLKDSGVKLLCGGLQSQHCKLETLSLSGCLITEEGCASLASALNSSNLRELDLCYNHPGEPGKAQLSDRLKDTNCRLEKLRLDHDGPQRLKPDVRKYACELELDTNTVYKFLKLSDNNTKVTRVWEEQPYPDHPDRFEHWPQLLCGTGVTDQCYWEVEWSERVLVVMTYKGITRRGISDECAFGWNDQSWSMICHNGGYIVRHNSRESGISSPSVSNRVGVYVDYPAGTLSFYGVLPDKLIYLHTFNTTFTEPLYPGVAPWSAGSSASLCRVPY